MAAAHHLEWVGYLSTTGVYGDRAGGWVDESGPLWVGSLGKANLESAVGADEETMYRIGSTSKMFVALAVLQLVEQGRLSLDDRLADLAPEIEFENRWEDSDPVRLVHLLEHTTGWDDIHLPEYAHNDPTPATLKEGLDFHPHSRESRWVPGSPCTTGRPRTAGGRGSSRAGAARRPEPCRSTLWIPPSAMAILVAEGDWSWSAA